MNELLDLNHNRSRVNLTTSDMYKAVVESLNPISGGSIITEAEILLTSISRLQYGTTCIYYLEINLSFISIAVREVFVLFSRYGQTQSIWGPEDFFVLVSTFTLCT